MSFKTGCETKRRDVRTHILYFCTDQSGPIIDNLVVPDATQITQCISNDSIFENVAINPLAISLLSLCYLQLVFLFCTYTYLFRSIFPDQIFFFLLTVTPNILRMRVVFYLSSRESVLSLIIHYQSQMEGKIEGKTSYILYVIAKHLYHV